MKQDYHFYLSGCREEDETPLPYWRFLLAYSLYQRHYYDAVDFDLSTGELSLRKDYFPLVPWARLRRLARAVDRGRELAQSGRPWYGDDDEQAGGPGVREPRRPVSPLLSDTDARSFDPPAYEYDRTLIH